MIDLEIGFDEEKHWYYNVILFHALVFQYDMI
jgi:hypothetical protein